MLAMDQSRSPGRGFFRRLGESNVTNNNVPSEDPVLIRDWTAALEQKVGHVDARTYFGAPLDGGLTAGPLLLPGRPGTLDAS
jgi:hypothetical protein